MSTKRSRKGDGIRLIQQTSWVSFVCMVLVACGGDGNGKSDQLPRQDPPAAPVMTVDADIKQLIFSWDEVAGATHYRLMENPDGHSGFTQAGEDILAGTVTVTKHIAVHLHDWANALYVLQACNDVGCSGSSEVSAMNIMLETIGQLQASNTGQDEDFQDYFGAAVALSADGSTLAVGAPLEDSAAIGIDGDQDDNSGRRSGAVYIYRTDGVAWSQEAYVKASNTGAGDRFGWALALSADGGTLAVGASSEAGGVAGVNGDQSDDSIGSAGAVYLFRYASGIWFQDAYIKASNPGKSDRFGSAVALSDDGTTLAVGANGESSASTGVNGDQDDNSSRNSGAVYVFRVDGISWIQQAYIKASNTAPTATYQHADHFGESVALSADGKTLAVGAIYEDSVATGVNGDQSDNWATHSGAVYVFRADGMTWSQEAYIKASNTDRGDNFGSSIALSADGDILAIGANREDSIATGVNGDQGDDYELGENAGAVYLFRFDGADWSQEAYIKASNSRRGGGFGSGLALSQDGNILAVTGFDDSCSVGIGGDQNDDSCPGSRAGYVFDFDGMEWDQRAYVKELRTRYGNAITLSADGTCLVLGFAWAETVTVL